MEIIGYIMQHQGIFGDFPQRDNGYPMEKGKGERPRWMIISETWIEKCYV